jgi:hypothetical protein
MEYKVTTSYLTGAGDMSHDDEWFFNTREEAQKFLDKFYEAFPKGAGTMDDPYIYTSRWKPEIEEVDDTRADPYAWLEKRIKEKKN